MELFDDIDDMWEYFYGIIQSCMDGYIPLKRVHLKYSKRPTPWLIPDILCAIQTKYKAKHLAECTCDPADVAHYKSIKNSLKMAVRSAKLDYLQSLLSHARGAPQFVAILWSQVNDVIGRTKLCKSPLDPALSLEDINNFFRTVAVSDGHNSPESFLFPSAVNSGNIFKFRRIEVSEVVSLLRNLNVKKSTRPDGISTLFLQKVPEEVAIPLSFLYNKSLHVGLVPTAWKKSNVTPIHKGGQTDDPGNYRPISVVPVVAKVFEKMVATQLNAFLKHHNLLHDLQGAYRHGRSADQILMYAVDTIVQTVDGGNCVCATFLDLRKAFDSLDHCILLQRLQKLGVMGVELRWFADYLTNRMQRVKQKDRYSDWGLVLGGIPQGSALSPLLFLVYVNEMPLQVQHGCLLQFADDTCLISVGDTSDIVAKTLQDDLSMLSQWAIESKMQLNIKKSSIMWFSVKRSVVSMPSIMVNNVPLSSVQKQKYLGITFDTKLN